MTTTTTTTTTTTGETNCKKCRGAGVIDTYLYRQGGKCFLCEGTGTKRPTRVKAAPVSASFMRESFIKAFATAIEPLRRGMPDHMVTTFFARPTPCDASVFGKRAAGLNYKEQIQAWLADPECPADVRARAIEAFKRLGVDFS